jgi:hypothetical protein
MRSSDEVGNPGSRESGRVLGAGVVAAVAVPPTPDRVGSPERVRLFLATSEFAMETRSVSEGPSADSGEVLARGENGVPR